MIIAGKEKGSQMPRGKPSAQTRANEKWQKKAGYTVKSFKIRSETAEHFAEACKEAGVSQAAKITELMESFYNT